MSVPLVVHTPRMPPYATLIELANQFECALVQNSMMTKPTQVVHGFRNDFHSPTTLHETLKCHASPPQYLQVLSNSHLEYTQS